MEIPANHTTSITDPGDRPLSAKIREQVQAVAEYARSSTAKDRRAATNILIVGPDAKERIKVALALAGEQNAELFRVDLSAMTSEFIDNIERNLDELFSRAERQGAVLLFDEADIIFGKRARSKSAHSRSAGLELYYLQKKLKSHKGLIAWAVRTASHRCNAVGVPLSVIVDLRKGVRPMRQSGRVT